MKNQEYPYLVRNHPKDAFKRGQEYQQKKFDKYNKERNTYILKTIVGSLIIVGSLFYSAYYISNDNKNNTSKLEKIISRKSCLFLIY